MKKLIIILEIIFKIMKKKKRKIKIKKIKIKKKEKMMIHLMIKMIII
jgi:hypothetical protein